VLLAILLDRITQSFGRTKRGGPASARSGLIARIKQTFGKAKPGATGA